MLDALLWPSITAMSNCSVSSCSTKEPNPVMPSEVTVCTGLSTAPNWSGTYSSAMAVPST